MDNSTTQSTDRENLGFTFVEWFRIAVPAPHILDRGGKTAVISVLALYHRCSMHIIL